MKRAIISLEIQHQKDIVLARQRTRHIASMLGFDVQDQTRLATAVSEIARNALQYAAAGNVEFSIDGENGQTLQITVRDRGRGVADLPAVLDGSFVSTPGRGRGIAGVRRLMDHFHMESTKAGTTVMFGKSIPRHVRPGDLARIAAELAKRAPDDPFEEMREQNRELLRTLEELRLRQTELAQANQELQRRENTLSELNSELADTNRGVVALYAELEEKAEFLGRASEMKSRFLSNMSHEFRTPLNSVTGLTRLLLDRTDGDLTPEQEKQVSLIRRAAENLTELVNDLLDLAKVEAGKVVVRPSEFDLASLFGGLRGMLRPLLIGNESVELIFDEPTNFPLFNTDESKVSQILRNLISNALKFTERGEIRVRAQLGEDDQVILSVADTGIGIAPDDHLRIFEDFVQVDGAHQKRIKGTGLGLPLVKKLTQLLGGRVTLQSALGQGSVFCVILPRTYHKKSTIVVIDDDEIARYLVGEAVKPCGVRLIEAASGEEGIRLARENQPRAVILDFELPDQTGLQVLRTLRGSAETAQMAVVVNTSKVLSEAEEARLHEAGACKILSKARLSDADGVSQFRAVLYELGIHP